LQHVSYKKAADDANRLNVVLIVYQRDKNEGDCQVMYKTQSKSYTL